MSENSPSNNLGVDLIVIRSDNMEKAAEFYAALGLSLIRHSHPPCGEHFSSTGSGCVFEICARRENQAPTTSVVLGFKVADLDLAVQAALQHGGTLRRAPEVAEWGRMATIRDLDGHTVILRQELPPGATSKPV